MSRPPWTVQRSRNEALFKVVLILGALILLGNVISIGLKLMFAALIFAGVIVIGIFLFELFRAILRRS